MDRTMTEHIECTGKSLVFTDLHVGISNDKPSRQKIAERLIDEICDAIEMEGIRQVFFLGDLFHQRTSIEVTSLNVANDIVRRLASMCEVFLLQGNHDLYEKCNSVITSLNIFDLNNVHIISTPTEMTLNSQRVLLVPWLCGMPLEEFIHDGKTHKEYDIMMGHFDISYSGDIRLKGQKYVNSYRVGGMSCSDVEKGNIVDEILHHTHDGSTIYLGHIHEHETLAFGNRTWNIVGSPQYQVHDMKRLPESRKLHGYFTLDESNKDTFHESKSVPRFVTVYASDVLNGKMDESKLDGAIIRRCYDILMNEEQRKSMDAIVSNANIYEEDSSVFMLGEVEKDGIDGEDSSDEGDTSILIDKFDYIKGQIDQISHPAIDNGKLLAMMKEYYDRAMLG